jgi:hypothetical protein
MTTRAQLEAQIGRKLRDDFQVVDDEVVRVDPEGTIVERFEAGKGNGVYLPTQAPEPLVQPTRLNRPGQTSLLLDVGPPPSAADRFPRDPVAIPPEHPHHVEPRSMRLNPNALYGNHRVKIVDGIATEWSDERGAGGDDDGGVRIVG